MYTLSNTELQSGKYRITSVLGQGGFGITYLAENVFLGKIIAIKEFFPKDFCGRGNTNQLTLGTQSNAETVKMLKERFLKEAKNIAKLDHPGIVKIHDIFEENNTAYYVMDYIKGETLSEMVKHKGPLSEAKAIEYIRKIGDALDYIHSNKMTHFDVKPANIMVRHKDDMPILIDFGLSKQYDIHGDATSTLIQGVSQGFSPIELYNAGGVSTFSPQTDIYSLGATLYFILTGTIPPVASQILEEGLQIPNPAAISLSTRRAIKSAMEASRSNRPQNITTFIDKLSSKRTPQKTTGSKANTTANEDTILITNSRNSKIKTHPKQPTQNSESNSPNSNNSILWIFGIIIAIILVAIFMPKRTDDTPDQADQDYAVVEEVVLEPVSVCDTTPHYIPKETSSTTLSTKCEVGFISPNFNERMLIPTYLNKSSYQENGWTIRSNNESELKSTAFYSFDSPEHLIEDLYPKSFDTYSKSNNDWAVRSGVYNNKIYYVRSANKDGVAYIFIYSVPLEDKVNAKVYNTITKKISSNFPL